jgi:hypothetical protein
MKLCDGYLNYQQFTPTEWAEEEALTFTNEGLIGIICDNQEDAFNELTPLLQSTNPIIYTVDEENSTINYVHLQYDISRFTDKMYDYIWRENLEKEKGYYFPPKNVPGKINFEYLDKQSRKQNFIGVVFIKISDKIKCLDSIASQIANDYTEYQGDNDNARHRRLRCFLSKYYIYNQDENLIYDFIEFER